MHNAYITNGNNGRTTIITGLLYTTNHVPPILCEITGRTEKCFTVRHCCSPFLFLVQLEKILYCSCCCHCKPVPVSILPLESTMESSDSTTASTAARTTVTGSHRVEVHAVSLAHVPYSSSTGSSWQ